MLRECFDLLTAADEDKRVNTLYTQELHAFASVIQQCLVDVALTHCMVGASFAYVHSFSISAHEVQHLRLPVDRRGPRLRVLHQPKAPKGEEVRVAGPAPTNKPHRAVFLVCCVEQ